jgi:hypothetical protein
MSDQSKLSPERPFEFHKGQIWVRKQLELGNPFFLAIVDRVKGDDIYLKDHFNPANIYVVKKPLDHWRYIHRLALVKADVMYSDLKNKAVALSDITKHVFDAMGRYPDQRTKPRQQKLPLDRKPDLPMEPAAPPVAKQEAPVIRTEPADSVFIQIMKEHNSKVKSAEDKKLEATVDQLIAEEEGRVVPKVVREPHAPTDRKLSTLERSLLQKQLEHHLLMAKAIKIALGLE